MRKRSRSYILTIPLDSINLVEFNKTLEMYFDYVVYQIEKGDTTGYKHIQLYLENESQIEFSTIKRMFPKAHIEKREGSKQQAYNYCTKEDTRLEGPFEFGTRPDFSIKEGQRTDLENFRNAVMDGASDMDLLMEFPSQFARYSKLADEIRKVLASEKAKEFRDVEVIYIWGPTHTGKSHYIGTLYPVDEVYHVNQYERAPFDDYKYEDIVILDEYRSNFKIADILTYTDGQANTYLPCRYSNKFAVYSKIYILSNIPLDEQYKWLDVESRNAFFRRISKLYTFSRDHITCVDRKNGFKVTKTENPYSYKGV